MHKKDYIAQVMAFYKELERRGQKPEEGMEIRIREPERTWEDLVNHATLNGMDNLELNDLILMASYAKDVLK